MGILVAIVPVQAARGCLAPSSGSRCLLHKHLFICVPTGHVTTQCDDGLPIV